MLLVSIDSLRADHLGCYGYPRDTSPTIDRLAREGVRFANALTPSSWTLPSHASMLTGTSQWRHEAIRNESVVSDDVTLLAEILQRRGFQTAGFYAGPFLDPAFGFGRGFDDYVSCMGYDASDLVDGLVESHADETNPIVLDEFGQWVRDKARSPFFAFVHLWDVHFDYIPPPKYVEMFDPGYDGRLDGRNIAKKGFPRALHPRHLAHLLARYDGEIRYTDDTVAELLDMLREASLLEDTLVVVTADHGEEFLEHGNKGHRATMFEEVAHVPLIFWAKRGVPRNRVVETPVSLEDVTPTILDLVGIATDSPMDGASLVPLWREPAARGRDVVGILYTGDRPWVHHAVIRSGTRKVIRGFAGADWASYDLSRDPAEQLPLPVSPDDPLRLQLQEHLDARLRAVPRAPRRNGRKTVPAHLEQQLRSLGYID